MCRQKYGPLINRRTGKIDSETFAFVKSYAKRWKEKTIFQVLLHYRAARYHDLVNMSQQVGGKLFNLSTHSLFYFHVFFYLKGSHF